MKGQGTYGTGDINLAAALAALGIEPDPIQPIELIARDNGKDYTRFHFSQISPCGKYEVTAMSAAWGDADTFKRENDSHPFSLLMEFIATRPRECSNQDQWLDHAAQFLALPLDAIRKTYRGIDKTCQASPESPVSYVLAFIRNRMDMITAAKSKGRSGAFSTMQSQGKSVSIIGAKAPPRIRDFLLSHIR
jgi:hypothetical protein